MRGDTEPIVKGYRYGSGISGSQVPKGALYGSDAADEFGRYEL
jgi:hypothetical protein